MRKIRQWAEHVINMVGGKARGKRCMDLYETMLEKESATE
jgi:hypothetical protein